MRNVVLLTVLTALLAACGATAGATAPSCADEMAATRAQRGEPDRVNRTSGAGYQTEAWSYDAERFAISFVWGPDVPGCEASEVTY